MSQTIWHVLGFPGCSLYFFLKKDVKKEEKSMFNDMFVLHARHPKNGMLELTLRNIVMI